MQDIAVNPLVFDPSRNTVECVIPGHGKSPPLPGLKKLLHTLCWSLLYISLVMGTFTSQWVIKKLRAWNKEEIWNKERSWKKTAAMMILSVFLFFGSLGINIYALIETRDLYVGVFLGFTFLVLLRRVVWCTWIHKDCNYNGNGNGNGNANANANGNISECLKEFNHCVTQGHGHLTSRNFFSFVFLYPAIFMACHHLLWILLGVITEPFWGFTILVAVFSVCTIFFFLVSELFDVLPAPQNSDPAQDDQPSGDLNIVFIMSFILSFAVLSAFVLLLLVLFAVAQVFLSESLVATLVQNALTFFVAAWIGYLGFKKEIITGELKIIRSKNNGNNDVRTGVGINMSARRDAGPST